jgi:hypothetical protein
MDTYLSEVELWMYLLCHPRHGAGLFEFDGRVLVLAYVVRELHLDQFGR